MAKVVPMFINIIPGPSEDVVTRRMYYEAVDSGNPVDQNSSPYVEMDAADMKIDLSVYPEIASMDGLYNVAMSSLDDRGNESDLTEVMSNVPFDFSAPLPPAGFSFSNE